MDIIWHQSPVRFFIFILLFFLFILFPIRKHNENKVLGTVPVFLPLLSPSHNNKTPFSKTKRRIHVCLHVCLHVCVCVCVWWHFCIITKKMLEPNFRYVLTKITLFLAEAASKNIGPENIYESQDTCFSSNLLRNCSSFGFVLLFVFKHSTEKCLSTLKKTTTKQSCLRMPH